MEEALQRCKTSTERFNQILAGQNFSPIGMLYCLKGSILFDTNRLAEAEPRENHAALLSDRELEVLRCLGGGATYEENGRQLFLSLNTVQFYVKNIHRKLLVSKPVQAIEKARKVNLI